MGGILFIALFMESQSVMAYLIKKIQHNLVYAEIGYFKSFDNLQPTSELKFLIITSAENMLMGFRPSFFGHIRSHFTSVFEVQYARKVF